MAHNTTRLGLNVVDGTDNVSAFPVADNQSKTILDTAVTFTSGTLAARPAASLSGRMYYATDNGQFYQDNGSAWVISAGFSSGTVAARPVAGVAGRVYYGTDTGLFYQDNGSVWGTALVAGAWQAQTLATGLSGSISARLEGDLVRLKGSVTNTTGSTITLLSTLTGPFQPSATRGWVASLGSVGGAPLSGQVGTAGQLQCPLTPTTTAYLDPCSYPLS